MSTLLRQYQDSLQNPRIVFPMLALLISGISILLFIGGVFPLSSVNFAFWTVLFGLGCLYRPNWGFLLLLTVLPFETLNLVSSSWGLMLRPYQWLFLILVAVLALRVLSGRTPWSLFRWHPIDGLLGLIPLGAFISGLAGGGEGIRLSVIVLSFYALYLLGRVFLKTIKDLSLAMSTFTAAGLPVLLYGVAQNVSFEFGGTLAAVMPGRPNATFAEPDWLGLFVTILFIFVFAALFRATSDFQSQVSGALLRTLLLGLLLVPIAITLILSVSRSAWLALALALLIGAGIALIQSGRQRLRTMFQTSELTVIAFILALFFVVEIPLTRFDLLNRAESTATGLQEITVACEEPTVFPDQIGDVSELSSFGCRHINLEEREALALSGSSIQTVRRLDPNVEIRSSIYRKTWEEIRQHPVLGIGWGNIGSVLGRDENGSAYNASNLWLEVWLGAGLLGLAGLLGVIVFVTLRLVKGIAQKTLAEQTFEQYPVAFAALVAFGVFNLFNAGLLIGFVWIWFAALPVLFPVKTKP
ncbi:MAG: O-antigen ligase family protein [Undibacterium sp.]